MSGVPKTLLAELDARDTHVCAWTGIDTGRLVPQHRQGGMGGRKGKHRLSNLVWLDSLLNGLIESDPVYQAEALHRGIKISLHADPLKVPVEHVIHGLVYLDDAGNVTEVSSGSHSDDQAGVLGR